MEGSAAAQYTMRVRWSYDPQRQSARLQRSTMICPCEKHTLTSWTVQIGD